jgi:PadR family transcriptional regulator PadR
MSQNSLGLLRGTLDTLILKTLSSGPMHGYEISKWVKQQTEDAIQIEEGALYPALRRLEKRGWLESEWGLSTTNREVKFYSLTGEGRMQLKAQVEIWNRYVRAMSHVLQPTGTRT